MLTVIEDRKDEGARESPVRPFGCRPFGIDDKISLIRAMDTAERDEWFIVDTVLGLMKFTDPVFFPAKRMNEWVVTVDGGTPRWWPEGELMGHLVMEFGKSLVWFVGKDENGVDYRRLVGDIYGYTLGKQE